MAPWVTTGSYAPPKPPGKYKGGGVGPSPTYSYTAAVVEVEVDSETGWITVPRIYIAHDIGPGAESGTGEGPGHWQRLYGTGRGSDGRAGLSAAGAETLRCPGAP